MTYLDIVSRLPNTHESSTQSAMREAQNGARQTDGIARDHQRGIGTFGLSVGNFAAGGVGGGFDFSESVRPGVGAEGALTVYAVVGPIIAVPLPANLPAFNIGLSAPPTIQQDNGLSSFDCAPLFMLVTPLMSIQVTPASINLSVSVSIQLGAAVGILCGVSAH